MSSPTVSTTYANGSTNTVRPETRVYPNGRTVTFDFGTAGGINDRLSRIESMVDDDDTVLAEYQYLGLGAVVQQDSPEADLRSTLVSLSGTNDPDTGDIYSGLDRFGRVTDVRWRDVSAASDLSRVQYGYDRASNRTFRKNPSDPNSHHDWAYGYDGLQRLKDAERGTLASPPTGVTNPQFAQCWTLDATGNWAGFRQANTGSPWSLVQARTANAVNEITGIANSTGSAWAQPAYDPAGNMTTIPQPDDPTGQYTATYDAWNRLVKLVDPATGHTVQENVYDARGYRIVKKTYTGGTLSETRHYYYTNGWRCVEERVGTSPDSAAAERQHVWGVRYIDDLVVRDRSVTGTLDERLYACLDGNWNTTAVIATDGTVQERYEYDPYGKLSVLAPDFTPRGSSNCDWNITYAGYRFDTATGLYQVRFRFLHTRMGWTARDPGGYDDGLSLYGYVALSPLIFADPFGLQRGFAPPTTPRTGNPNLPRGIWPPKGRTNPGGRNPPPPPPPPPGGTPTIPGLIPAWKPTSYEPWMGGFTPPTPPMGWWYTDPTTGETYFVEIDPVSGKIRPRKDIKPPSKPPKKPCPKSCKDQFPELESCLMFPESPIVQHVVELYWKGYVVLEEAPAVKDKCAGGDHFDVLLPIPEGGIAVPKEDRYRGSILCCPCCLDTQFGPVESFGCRYSIHK